MARWPTLAIVVALSLSAGRARAQTYPLAEAVKPGDCFRVQIDMSLSGEIRITQEGKPVPRKQTATASHAYTERILNLDAAGLPDKAARHYTTAQARITVAADRSDTSLRPERRLLVAQRLRDQTIIYCPSGPMLHDEIEVTEHFDTLTLTGLLPGKEVKVEETWKISNTAAQALCHFDGLTEQDLKGKLLEVKNGIAQISITGPAVGIELGALVKLQIEATAHFDLGARRLTWLEWKQKDERDQGPASPASSVQVTTTVKRVSVAEPEQLTNVALVSVPPGKDAPPAHMTQVLYIDAKSRYDVMHGREWVLVGQTADHVVLRLLEQGDFVAQVTITPWTSAEKGKHMDPEKFKETMARTPGWDVEKELQVGEVPSDDGKWVYRVSAQGLLDGAAVMQNFYLVAAPTGEQVVLVFTMTPKQVDKLGSRDLSLVGSLDFPGLRKGQR